ncbi:MAG: hypothetical protein KKH98_11845 [Spirochaetes bacterium]|nr:hypothetical protein [Spirochaetota bacterium]
MKIAIMGGWNTDSGASLHSESIGRKFIEMGHDLKVFSFYDYAFHGTQITGEDEKYVTQCFTHFKYDPLKLDVIPFITNDYDLFIAEDIGMFPKDLLAKIFYTHIKKKAKTITVYHDNQLSKDPSFYQFDWDSIVCFDQRFKDVLTQAYPEEKVHIIPYPCHEWSPGDKKEARKELHLPEDKKIIFTFGLNTNRILPSVEDLNELHKDFPEAMLLALTKDMLTINKLKKLSKKIKIQVKIIEEAPSINRLYKYLHASDIMLYYRDQVPFIVVGSTVLQCLGSGCPIIGNETKFTEIFDNEIFKYTDKEEFISGIKEAFRESKKYKSILENAKKYSLKNSSEEIAKKFIELYKKL